jgi:hypothetical protein
MPNKVCFKKRKFACPATGLCENMLLLRDNEGGRCEIRSRVHARTRCLRLDTELPGPGDQPVWTLGAMNA